MLKKIKKFFLPELEKKVLEFWRTNHIFKKVQDSRKNERKFVFYEGPPTANGKPGLHHVLSRSFKDVVLRYKTMRGYYVTRRGGWDTHGLPVELEVEKKLGLKSKGEIEDFGIAEFNKRCKESVWSYKTDWEQLTERVGFWLDMDNPYITYENSYIETLWWIIYQIHRRKLLYKAHKVVPWCPRCGTALSSHELAQGYKEVEDTSVFVKFNLKDRQKINNISLERKAYILSWTTTPWTLPGNVALAVGSGINYIIVENKETKEKFIIAKKLKDVLDFEYETIAEVKGKDLAGLRYHPLFDVRVFSSSRGKSNAYKVYTADFVSTEEGTGVVHTAVMYGEDDYNLGQDIGLPTVHTVDESGKFVEGVGNLKGMKTDDPATEEKIMRHLKDNNFLFKDLQYSHDYPFCWRCDSRILYYARDSWFVAMSKVKNDLIKSNKKVNWIPDHIKEGRFGEWLKNVKDWAISRERYWGTPLPVWQCDGCGKNEVVSGFGELSKKAGGANNKYIAIRHGEAEHNTTNTINSNPQNRDMYNLTAKGRKQSEEAAKKLKRNKPDLIFTSDFNRTKETADIIGKELGIKPEVDVRLREVDTGIFNGRDIKDYRAIFENNIDRFGKRPPNGENLRDVAKRVWDFISETEKKYKNKTILVVSHGNPVWMMRVVAEGWGEDYAAHKENEFGTPGYAIPQKTNLLVLPRNEWGIADPHRPYVDDFAFKCKCGGNMKRVPEVVDVWFDSGAMPWAQAHFPFGQLKLSEAKNKWTPAVKKINFPADYIVEGIDQTRGWFYTLLAISVLLKQGNPYKNVVSLELLLDKYGRKMSKSKGNVVDPWDVAKNFGMDVARWHFFTINPPGEPKKFDEQGLNRVLRNFIFIIYNSFSFFDTYTEDGKIKIKDFKPENRLDLWILSRLYQVVENTRRDMDRYEIQGTGRTIEEFVDDLSKWYIRRSRGRFQEFYKERGRNKKDYLDASATLATVFLDLSRVLAPFVPFFAEALYQSMKEKISDYEFKESVHMEEWPKAKKDIIDKNLINNVKEVREIASLALSEREKKGIKVRQPLKELVISNERIKNKPELLNLLKEEINVKKISFDKNLAGGIHLNTNLTHELLEEGWLREFMRLVQVVRKNAGFSPEDKVVTGIETTAEIERLIDKNLDGLKKKLGVSEFHKKTLKNYTIDKETNIGDHKIKITIKEK